METTSINPVVLVAAGTVAVGLAAAVTYCASVKPAAKSSEAPAAEKATPSSASTSKQKKKSKATKKTGSKGADIDAPGAPAPAPVSKAAATVSTQQTKEVPKKSILKKEKPAGSAAEPKMVKKAVTEPSPDEDDEDEDDFIVPVKAKKSKETPEQRAARLERQRIAKELKDAEELNSMYEKENAGIFTAGDYVSDFDFKPQQSMTDGWAVVENKGKAKRNSVDASTTAATNGNGYSASAPTAAPAPPPAPTAAAEPAPTPAPAGPVVEILEATVSMEAKKVGGIIGAKGSTRKALEDATGCVINIPRERDDSAITIDVSLSGTKQAISLATKAINDFNTKGYICILEGDDFSEGHMTVHPRNIADLIGKGGCVRKALEAHTGVRINIPPNVPRTQTTMVKVDLAGNKGKIADLKKIVKELVKYYHTEVTHPGMVHEEISHEEVNPSWYNLIIGKGGSEIRHVQNNFKVSVHIPNDMSQCENLLIVGLPENVAAAKAYILKIIEKAIATIASRDKERQQAEADAAAARTAAEEEDEPKEEWMQQYIHPSKRKGSSSDEVTSAIDSAFPVLESAAPSTSDEATFPLAASASADGPVSSSEASASAAPQGAWAPPAATPSAPATADSGAWAAGVTDPFST